MSAHRNVSELMRRQLGLVTHRQALEHGLESHQVDWLVRSHKWQVVIRGVYAVEGTRLDWYQRALAACLSVEPSGVATLASAAHLWELDGFRQPPAVIDIATHKQVRRMAKGTKWHIVEHFDRRDVIVKRGVPVTSLPRTLVDLAGTVTEVMLEIALDSALRRKPKWRGWIESDLARFSRRRHGMVTLRRLLDRRAPVTDSPLEVMVRRLVWAAGLPTPLGPYAVKERGQQIACVDFAWPERRLAIQAQGYQFHHGRQRFEVDLKQISQLQSYGWVVWQPTMQRIEHDVADAIEELRRLWALTEPRRTA